MEAILAMIDKEDGPAKVPGEEENTKEGPPAVVQKRDPSGNWRNVKAVLMIRGTGPFPLMIRNLPTPSLTAVLRTIRQSKVPNEPKQWRM